MPIYTQARTGMSLLSDMPAPLSDVLGATAEEAITFGPTSSFGRMVNQNAAEGRYTSEFYEEGHEFPDLMAAEDARARIKEEGLDLTVPDDGIRKPVLDLLIERKKAERKRNDILSRAKPGIGTMSARLATALGASLLDPLNVASAFIPAVGPARYAMMLERAGSAVSRAGVRAGVGAVEGTLGAALVEPIVLSQARREQADYDLTDSLLNIALGTVLGGGLHVGSGAVADALGRDLPWSRAQPSEPLPQVLNRMLPEQREALLRTAVSQATTGRNVNIEAMARLNPEFDRLMSTTSLSGGRMEFTPELAGAAREVSEAVDAAKVLVARLNKDGQVRVFGTREEAERASRRIAKSEGAVTQVAQREDGGFFLQREAGLDFLRNPDGTPRLFDNERQVQRYLKTVRSAQGRELKPVEIRQDGRRKFALVEGATDEDLAAIRAMPDQVSIPRREDLSAGGALDLDRQARLEQGMERVRQAAKEYNDIRQIRLADVEASRYADERIAGMPMDDNFANDNLEAISTDVRDMAETLEVTDDLAREMAEYDALIETAEAYGNAVRAAAACGLRRGA